MKMRYDDGKENFNVDFTQYPDKYKQLQICKSRGRTIEVIISHGDKVRKILSDNLHFYN